MNLAHRLVAPSSSGSPSPVLTDAAGRVEGDRLGGEVARWRGALVAAGVSPGDRVAIVAGNERRFVLAHLATVGLGAVTVPLNPEAPTAELHRDLDLAEPVLVVTGDGPAAGLDPDAGAVAHLDPGVVGGASAAPVLDVEPDHPAVLMFTSGTAGQPRPAVLTHGNLEASLDALVGHAPVLTDRRHVVLAVVPLFHVFGLAAVLHLGLALGSELVLIDRPGPARVAEEIVRRGVTVLGGPPALWHRLADDPSVPGDALAGLAVAVSGAAKLEPETALAVERRFGLTLVEGYGLAETGAAVASALGTDAPVGSVGRLLPGVEARVVDPDGEPVLVGDPGELWIRGPMLSPGYRRPGGDLDPVAVDGWFRTGDVAVVDDDGHLAIVDRIKDLILVSGFNVHPGEVETALRDHPGVADAAVVGRPDPRTGERVVAHVVPAAPVPDAEVAAGAVGPPPPEELVEHCRSRLARYKVPVEVILRDELPVGVAGKVRRRLLS